MEAKNLIVIGPRIPDTGKPGGVVVLFELFVRQLAARKMPYTIIDINKENYRNMLLASVQFCFAFFCTLPKATHVSVHLQNNDYALVAPLVVFLCRVFRKPVSLRKFAGDFDEQYALMGPIKRRLIRYAARNADVLFFETCYLVERFRIYNPATYWMPNYRERSSNHSLGNQGVYGKRLVFLGQVCREKGIDELLEASQKLGDDYTITICGPLTGSEYKSLDWSNFPNVYYAGQLSPDEVPAMLAEQDILVLPSYREGYPGVVIEALFAGLPVIATNLRGIREMVSDGVAGFLVEPKSVSSLVDAIKSIDNNLFRQMSKSATQHAAFFDADNVMVEFLEKTGIEP